MDRVTIAPVRSATERRELLKAVYEEARGCVRCPLHQTRTTVVFGAGNADADLMFIGEAPGANEDRLGLPFVGQAGKLLDKLLGEIGLERGDVFICNTLKCRPPGNRDPHPNEIESCQRLSPQPGRADRADRDLHAGQLLDQAAARRHDRHLPAARPRGGADDRAAGGAAVSALPPGGRALHARRRSRRCGPISSGSPSCWRSGRPSSRESASRSPSREPDLAELTTRRGRASAGAAGAVQPAPELGLF